MERRVVWAILLMMAIAIAPALLVKKPDGRTGGPADRDSVPGASVQPPAQPDSLAAGPPARAPAAADTAAVRDTVAEDTVLVSSPLYTYGVSTRGGRFVAATLKRYRTMAPGRSGPVQLLPDGSNLLGLTLVSERDTVDLSRWSFTPSASSLNVQGRTPLGLSGSDGTYAADLEYAFVPDEYRVDVSGRVRGVGPNGGLLLVGMGPGLAQT